MHLSFFKIKIKRIWIITKFIFIIVTMVSNNVFSESLQFTSVSGGNNLTLSAVTSGQEENQSLLLDIYLIMMTVMAIIDKKRALNQVSKKQF